MSGAVLKAGAARHGPVGGSFGAMLKMCSGMFGVQIAWSLQNANTSRIFQTLGADVASLPILWIAGPITGLVVQPIIGYLSDRTWTPIGRRRPYILAGGCAGAIFLVAMAEARTVWEAALALWFLTAGLNLASEPFRALIADNVTDERRTSAFAIQGAVIGAGAVFASALPWLLSFLYGEGSTARGGLPTTVRVALAICAAGLLAGVAATVFTTRELPPDPARGRPAIRLLDIFDELVRLPKAMRRLGAVQFFAWFGLFILWVYAAPAVAANSGVANLVSSHGYNAVADWVGVMFALYNGVAVVVAPLLSRLAAKIGRRETHAVCLGLGAAGLLGFGFIHDPRWLWAPAVGIGCAWASILSIPYAMVATSAGPDRMGLYMGLQNIFIVLPQLAASFLLGWIVSALFGDRPGVAFLLAAGAFVLAAVVALTIPDGPGNGARET
ncbi:MAG TPA: MFS transporter [Caulobacteraceae bacterium]|jgi:maltose/moltooligosaccharide transporter|nr:MFS transporter [Caulobacteraceae bacterium]